MTRVLGIGFRFVEVWCRVVGYVLGLALGR